MFIEDAFTFIDVSGVLQTLDHAVINAHTFHARIAIDFQMHGYRQTGDFGLRRRVFGRVSIVCAP